MIGISKYEGHTPAPWHIENEENDGMRLFICSKDATILWQCETTHADALLVADAPLLLAEVKRLRRVIEDIKSMIPDKVSPISGDILMDCYGMVIERGEEEHMNWYEDGRCPTCDETWNIDSHAWRCPTCDTKLIDRGEE